jgi:hypothetical protein
VVQVGHLDGDIQHLGTFIGKVNGNKDVVKHVYHLYLSGWLE